jgi:hypothetical protein
LTLTYALGGLTIEKLSTLRSVKLKNDNMRKNGTSNLAS